MSRPVESITIHYRDEVGTPQTLDIPTAETLNVGDAVNRITNGAVTQGSHVISKNGEPCEDNAPLADGDRLTGSPRKTGGGH